MIKKKCISCNDTAMVSKVSIPAICDNCIAKNWKVS